jgi:hypothetical protein
VDLELETVERNELTTRVQPQRAVARDRHVRYVRADEPDAEGIAELLDDAEDIINSAGPNIMAEIEAEKANKGFLKKLRRKGNKKKKRR